jgi:hypothetical protein
LDAAAEGGAESMKIAAAFLLVVGCLWALFVVWMFLAIAGIADWPESITMVTMAVLYWGGMLVGPLALFIGAVLSLRGASLRPGAILIGVGCVILTCYVLYNSIVGMQHKPLQAPPPYKLYMVMLVIMLLSDAAAYKVYRALGGLPRASR